MGAASKMGEIYKAEGALGVVTRGIKKTIRPILDTNSAIWLERSLELPLPDIKPEIPVEAELFSANETIQWIKNRPEAWVYNAREIETGLQQKHYFPNIKYRGEIIGFTKVGINEVYIEDYKKIVKLPLNFAFIYDTFVIPEFRKQNIASFLLGEVIVFLRTIGVKKIGCHIPPWNRASLKTYEGMGFKRVKYIRYFKVFNFDFFSSKPDFEILC